MQSPQVHSSDLDIEPPDEFKDVHDSLIVNQGSPEKQLKPSNRSIFMEEQSPNRQREKPGFRGGYAIEITEGQELSLFDIHNKTRTILDHKQDEIEEILRGRVLQ